MFTYGANISVNYFVLMIMQVCESFGSPINLIFSVSIEEIEI